MTHFNTIDEVVRELVGARPGTIGTIRTTIECGRLVANSAERQIHSIAHITGIDLEMTKRKGFLDVTFYLTAEGDAEKLASFFRRVQRLET